MYRLDLNGQYLALKTVQIDFFVADSAIRSDSTATTIDQEYHLPYQELPTLRMGSSLSTIESNRGLLLRITELQRSKFIR